MKPSREAIAQWCQEYVAGLLDLPVEAVDLDADFDRLGIDSPLAVALLMEIEERYGVDLPPEALFENPTINAIAAHLYEQNQRHVA
ncbi:MULTISPECIES: acyl carrier protein [unclassified Frankia]|uniref:acyl carrier protein n=1 Tax=unclassified Frankia TaxID=2632575 RepID=UPI002AD23F44|nr:MULTISPECIES: acyl carrier protein [unclassified Frankia]